MEQLKDKQKVVFTTEYKIYTYIVHSSYLSSADPYTNGQMLTDLGLDRNKFCSDCYGYEANSGSWPFSKIKDYAALTRVIEALFSYCDEVTVDGNIVYSKSEKTIPKESEPSISSSKSESSDIIDFESIVKSQTIKLNFI